VEAVLIWGDIRFGARIRWGRLTLWEHVISLGDLVVSAKSASALEGVNASIRRYPVVNETVVEIHVSEPEPPIATRGLEDWLPPEYHINLLEHPKVRQAVIENVRAHVGPG